MKVLFNILFLSFFATKAYSFNYNDLVKIIQANQITTIDELLPLIPEDYRKSYTFVYESRSFQRGNVSPEWPRIILWGNDAKFFMAFTKNPKTAPVYNGADSIETIQFNDETKEFEFRVINFKEGTNPLNPMPEKNPAVCLSCHGKDPRPNWDTYNFWPGVYGSVSNGKCETMKAGSLELKNYLAFMKENRHRDRFQFLPPELPSNDCPNDPATEVTFYNAQEPEYYGISPNGRIGHYLNRLNPQRIGRLVKNDPNFNKFKYAVAAIAERCDRSLPIDSLFPEQFRRERNIPNSWATYENLTKTSETEFIAKRERFYKYNPESNGNTSSKPDYFNRLGDTDVHLVANIKYFADLMGFDAKKDRWSTAFDNGSFDFKGQSIATADFILSTIIDHQDPLREMSCEALKKASLENW